MESITSALLEPDKITECKLSKPSSCSKPSQDSIKKLEIKSDTESNYLKSNGDVNFCFNTLNNDERDLNSSSLFCEATDNVVDVAVNCKSFNNSTILESRDHLNTPGNKIETKDVYSDQCSNTKSNSSVIINSSNFIESVKSDGIDCSEINADTSSKNLNHLVAAGDQNINAHFDHASGDTEFEVKVSKDLNELADGINSFGNNEISQNKPLLQRDDTYSKEILNAYPSTSSPNINTVTQVMYSNDSNSQGVSLESIASCKSYELLGSQEYDGSKLQNSQELENLSICYDENIQSGLDVRDEEGNDIENKYEEEKNYSNSLQEIGTCITKMGTESITCMSDCTKVIFEGVCLDDSLISVSEAKLDTDISSSSVTCYMQTVVEGTLQPLNVNEIKKAEQIKKDSVLFAAVSEELTQIDSGSEPEIVEGIVVQSVENLANVNDDYNKDNVHLINLTEPPPIKLASEILKPDYSSEIGRSDDEKDDSKYVNNKFDLEKYQNFSMPVEGKPFLLKILPLKNGHGLWFPCDLNVAIAEKGSVLLRLCAAPEAGDEDLIEGPQADFSALLLQEKVKVPNFDTGAEQPVELPSIFKSITNNEDDDDDERIFAPPIVIETPKPLLPLSLISRQDFMERLQRPESPHLYEELPLSLKWKVRNAASLSRKRKCLSVPFTSVYRSKGSKSNTVNLTANGRRRGRPPLHNRGLIHNQFSMKRKFMEGPIKFRPPTPPSFLFSEESKDSVDVKNNIPKKALDPRALCPSLAGLKKAAPGSILSKQLQAFKAETKKNESRDESVSEASDDIVHTDGEIATLLSKVAIPCQYCDSVFRKKSALTMHLKMRHRLLRKCPICNKVVRVKGKLGLKYHNLEYHSDTKSFQCEFCDESFQLLHQLKSHTKLTHSNARNSDDENFVESGSETDSKNSVCVNNSRVNEPKKLSDRNLKATENHIKSDIDSKACKKLTKAKDKRKIESSIEDSDSKESFAVTWEGRTRLRSQVSSSLKGQTVIETDISNSCKSKEQDDSGESGNESDDEGDDSSGSSDLEVEEPKNYFCSQCDEGFSHLFKLKHHHKEKHSSSRSKDEIATGDEEEVDEGDDDDDDSSSDVDNSSKNLEVKHSCKICNKKCKSMYQLRIHNLQHNLTLKQKGLKIRGPSHSTELGESVVLRSSKIVEKKDAVISDITESHAIRSNLRTQKAKELPLTKNVEEKPQYPVSNKESNNVTNKLKIMRDKNRPSYIVRRGRVYCCMKCNINFKREKSMTYHLKKVHETLYPFRACPHCSRVFRSCGPYVRHLSQHSGKKCPVDGCKAKYKILRLIKKHQRHSHPDKPYRCTRCVELFAKEKELQNHVESRHVGKMKDDDDDEIEEENDYDDQENDKNLNIKKNCSKKSHKPDAEENKKSIKGKEFKFVSKRKQFTEKKFAEKVDEEEIEENKIRGKVPNGSKYTIVGKHKLKLEDATEDVKTVSNKIFKLGTKRKFSKLDEEDLDCLEDANVECFAAKKKSSAKAQKFSNSEEHLPIRRSRSILISYKEDDDDSSTDKHASQQNLKMAKSLSYTEPTLRIGRDEFSCGLLSENNEISLNTNNPKSLSVPITPNQSLSSNSNLISSNFTVPVVKQKRPYHRKVPYNKKRQEISWTAALKAKYGLNARGNNLSTNEPGTPTSSIYSPAITADVVRRVAESLLSRHQEQQQKQQEKLQKKLKKQQKKIKISSSIKYTSASSLPRIPYGSHLSSRDDSLSSFGDSSHTDQLSDYCGSSHSSANKVPEEEDGSPAKVIRFDSF